MENVKKMLKVTGIALGVGILIIAPGGLLAGIYFLAKHREKSKNVHNKRAGTSGKTHTDSDGRVECAGQENI